METRARTENAVDGLVLGLDVGTNSVGWALVRFESSEPRSILAAGVRVFQDEGARSDIEQGRDQPPGQERRQARLIRRQHFRRSMRRRSVFRLLRASGLLPPGDSLGAMERHSVIAALDEEFGKWIRVHGVDGGYPAPDHSLPYLLRSVALDREVPLHALGRIFYHLAQRRGFQSNRKAPAKLDEDEGKVKAGISTLARAITETGARTLGEYLSRVDPGEERLRDRYTHRDMFKHEFDAIWKSQSKWHPAELTDDLRNRVFRTLFWQRPLQSGKSLVGHCDLEFHRPRAPWACEEAQRFRMLQKVNDLVMTERATGEVRKLDDGERTTLLDALESRSDMTFPAVRKLLRAAELNLERGGEDRLPGNRLSARVEAAAPGLWNRLSSPERESLLQDLRSFRNATALGVRLHEVWSVPEEQAGVLAEVRLEPGHCSLSRKALRRLLPLMEKGVPFSTARSRLYSGGPSSEAEPTLALVSQAFPTLRNPIVGAALAEVRRVVNAIVRKYGRPVRIRVELARDLKKGRRGRAESWKKSRRLQSERRSASAGITERFPSLTEPRPSDILKFRLAEECGWQCPYTGRTFGPEDLFGAHPTMDVEHIIPFSRSLDDSYFNKTLCDIAENRASKKNRTPTEAYASNPDRWEAILARVKKFKGEEGKEKARRFVITREEAAERFEDFSERQLNDTRYASLLTARFLGRLFGGPPEQHGVDADGVRRVEVLAGGVTGHLRGEWQLNPLLGGDSVKSRDDHRHHALDAVCVALSDPGVVRRLALAAERAEESGRRRFEEVPLPWPEFREEVARSLDGISISFRIHRRVRGALHKDTIYPRNRMSARGVPVTPVRRPIGSLSQSHVEQIRDDAVRGAVEDALKGREPSEAFALKEDHPRLPSGRPIHHVTLDAKRVTTTRVGAPPRDRLVSLKNNHHVEFLERVSATGEPGEWEDAVVTMLEAHRRKAAADSVVKCDHGAGFRFLFSLAAGDAVRLRKDGVDGLYRTDQLSKGDYVFRRNTDARPAKEVKATGGWIRVTSMSALRALDPRKVVLDALGEERRAHD